MSSVTEVAVPTSDFDGNAPANGSRDMASTFSESLYWRRSARRYELLGLVSWMLAALSCVVFLAILLACFCRDSLWCRWPADWLVWVAGATVTRVMPGISLSGPFTRR
jgi:hypothetical protein